MLVSKYGFTNILLANQVVLDPSRIAAQIVTGVGFIGGGLIFVRRDSVRGLTTAATVWLTASVGMACGAGLLILALVVTAGHFIVVFAFPYLVVRLPKSRWTPSGLRVAYEDGRGILREIMVICTKQDFAISRVRVEREQSIEGELEQRTDLPTADAAPKLNKGIVTVALEVQGTRSVAKLAERLAEIDGVVAVNATDVNLVSD
jgi:putative Mg2+ transporter-C (MgtC) family protein